MKNFFFIILLILWNCLIILSFVWNYRLVYSNNNELVINKSRSFFEQILVSRMWNSEHGGVYVRITDKTKPNPYLKDSLRDLVTTNGLYLTKINPAFMTRQIAELNKVKNDLQFHITSLNPLRPENKADSWETKSLKMFGKKNNENFELILDNSSSQYRYMAPLITEKSCLKCHAEQGYKYGDIRGGISVSFPAKNYLSSIEKQIFSLTTFHSIILFIGIGGLFLFYRASKKYVFELKKKNQELIKNNMEKDKLFSIIAHDLRAPFNGFLGLTKIMSEEINDYSVEEIKKFSHSLNNSAENVYVLLENLLSWSLLQRNELSYNPENICIKDSINTCYNVLEIPIKNKKQNVNINATEELYVFTDRKMLNTIIRNLLSNASKFTPEGGTIIISSFRKDNEIITSIKDTGIGIPDYLAEKLFILGEKNSRIGTNNEPSSGLGLLLCKEFIEKNNGKLWMETEENIGTTFYFSLQIAKE